MAQMRGNDVGKVDVFGLRNHINESYFAVYSRTLRCSGMKCCPLAFRLSKSLAKSWVSY
jgi:hypothetical protein